MVADAANIQKSYFEVLGLCCASEVPLVEKIIKSLNGVKEVSVIVPTRTVIVVHDNNFVSRNRIVEELNQARLEANVRPDGEVKFRKKWPGPGTLACGTLLALSFLKYVYSPMQWLALIAVVIGLPSIIWRSISALRNLSPNINILVLISVGGTLALQDYWEAASIVFLFNIAQWLESRASHKAMAVMSSLMSMAPQKAIIAETGREVDVNNVMVNTVLAVRSGDAIPIDGVVVGGTCEVDEKMLTGESFPVTKQLESTVYAGTINLDGYITVKTTVLAEDCVVARMVKLVEEAHNKKSRFQRYIDECAKYYIPGMSEFPQQLSLLYIGFSVTEIYSPREMIWVPNQSITLTWAVVLISLGVAVIPAAFGVQNKQYWFHLALVVLVSTCPCALILATPVAVFCALSKLATTGMLVKGGEYLEILAKVKTVAFDKTGTITRGEFIVVEFQTISDLVSFDKLLYWVSSIESKSSHPMATALINHGRLHSVAPKPENVDDFQNFPGEGIYGKIDGKTIYIGKKRIALRAGCKEDPTQEIQSQEDKANGYVYLGATLVGIFSLSDACRSTSLKAIEELKSLGIKTVMLTGDSHAAAVHVQHQLEYSLDVVHAELLPEDKARFIEDFKKDGPVAMVGDGINDAPALAIADIGISMGISGSALATESGNIILMSNDIQKIPKAIQLARKTHRKLTENIVLSITTKGAILALAFAGYPLVSAAILTDVGTCLLVILNSMLLLQGTREPGGSRSRRTSDNIAKQMSEPLQGSSERQYGTFRPHLSDDNASSCLLNEQSGCGDRSRVSQGCEDGCCKKVIEGKSPQSVDKPSGSKASNCVSCKKGKCTSSAARQGVNVDKPIGSKASNCVSCKKGNCTSSAARRGVNVEDDALNMV